MATVLYHRGPEQDGFYLDENVSLGHRRLKIIDLSDRGRQPMSNEDGSIQVLFNGEIYNFREIRDKLENKGHRFCSESDTEVIVHAYEEAGTKCVNFFNGMFAFAVWDTKRRTLFLARDRLGIKPLYYYSNGDKFIFASEVKAILQDETVKRELNRKALLNIVDFLFPLTNETLLEDVYELEPGCTLVYDTRTKALKTSRYWDLADRSEQRTEAYFTGMLSKLLSKSVSRMLVSDVPLGATLSGGLDSSVVVALMSKASEQPVRTFTVGFEETANEFDYARLVANHCGTKHEEIVIPFADITKSLPEIVWHMETVITRTSTFPTYFYSQALKKKVTVTLVGEGGDEVFAGYPRYKVFSPDAPQPRVLKDPAAGVRQSFLRERHKRRIYSPTMMELEKEAKIEEKNIMKPYFGGAGKDDLLNKALVFEIKKQLPGVHLLRVDRMTMAHAVEARVPFLDHEAVEFSMRIPSSLKLHGADEKYVLKKVALGLLPKQVITRRKMGLATPVSRWFAHDFYDIVPALLSEASLRGREYLNTGGVRDLLTRRLLVRKVPTMVQHALRKSCLGKVSDFLQDAYASKLWFLCMIELWYRMFVLGDVTKPKMRIRSYLS